MKDMDSQPKSNTSKSNTLKSNSIKSETPSSEASRRESPDGTTPQADELANPRRKVSLPKKLAFLGIILACVFVMTEGLLVLCGISYPLLYQPDWYCATRLKSHLNVRYIEEGQAWVQSNAAGFRDIDHEFAKPDGTYRIAVVGDSFCEALSVDLNQTFWKILEQDLNAHGHRVEVLNFGISGFGTAQAVQALEHHVQQYDPDLVILAMFLGNDIGDNSRKIIPGQVKPYYDLIDGQLVLDTSFRSAPEFLAAQSRSTQLKAALINSSRTLQLINKVYSNLRNRNRPVANTGIGLDPELYAPPVSEAWKDAWQVTESLLRLFHDKCIGYGAECLVVTLSNPIQVHPLAEVRAQFVAEHQLQGLFYPDDRLGKFFVRHKISFLQLSKHFRSDIEAADSPIYFHGFENTELGTGHWNAAGHARAAQLISEYIAAKLREK